MVQHCWEYEDYEEAEARRGHRRWAWEYKVINCSFTVHLRFRQARHDEAFIYGSGRQGRRAGGSQQAAGSPTAKRGVGAGKREWLLRMRIPESEGELIT